MNATVTWEAIDADGNRLQVVRERGRWRWRGIDLVLNHRPREGSPLVCPSMYGLNPMYAAEVAALLRSGLSGEAPPGTPYPIQVVVAEHEVALLIPDQISHQPEVLIRIMQISRDEVPALAYALEQPIERVEAQDQTATTGDQQQ